MECSSVESTARVELLSNFFKGKMLNRSDDVDCFQCFRDSSKETIRQTMVNQELVFRKQVFELHQLYRVQIAMMEDFKQKGLDNHHMHNIGMSPVPVKLNNQLKCSMKPLNLQLSADEFINQCVDDFSGKRVVTSLKESIVSKSTSWDSVVLDLDRPNLPFNIGQDAKIIDGKHRFWKGKETCSSSTGVSALADENLSSLNYEANLVVNPGSSVPISHSGHKNKLDSFLISDKHNLENISQSGIKDDGSYGNALIRSVVHAGASCQSQPLSDLGSNRNREISFVDNLSNKNQDSPTCKVNNLDLNTVQLEDLSSLPYDHSIVGNSSITSSSPMLDKVHPNSNVASSVSPASWRGADVNQFTNLHEIHHQKDLNLENNMGEQGSMVDKLREGDKANISFVNVESDSSGEFWSGPKISSVGSTSKVSNGLSSEMDIVDAVGEKLTFEKRVKHFEHANCCKLPSFSESDCVIDHQTSSIKTMQSGVECDDNNISSSVEREKFNICSLVAHSREQDRRSSDSIESNTHCFITKEAKVDGAVKTAAELLVQISLVTETFWEADLAKTPVKKTQNEEDEQPQCSSESYEAMVLKAEECSPDDYNVSSNAFVVDESDNKDVMYKLKRGTRMKDFQKDILPCLSTLSRHEIREDVNILEGVIRSREYKKMRGKTADGGDDCGRTTRSKRSRVSRRYYA